MTPCIPSTGYIKENGYGQLEQHRPAHRVVWEREHGVIAKGWDVDHLCHTADKSCPGGWTCVHRRCINLDHLELVPHAVNLRRGRMAKLSEAQVAAIRQAHAEGVGVRELGRRYGIAHSQISRITRGIGWRPVEIVT